MITVRRLSLAASLFAVLPTYAAAQTLPTTPPSGYYNAVASNPKGTVTNITYGSNYAARVYTPPGYSTSRTYAAMYLMHGMGGSEASWHDNDLYAHIQLDNLIAQGKVDPFIIVFTRNDMNNWGFGPILLDQLMPYIEANYCVSTDPNNRALGGLSMGGMLTINIGFPNADKFHYLMPSSPAPGIQGDAQLFPSSLEAARQAMRLVFFTCGSGEVGAYGCNNVDTVSGYAKNHGLGSIIKEWIVQGGAHNAATWRPSFWNYAQLAHQAGFTRVETAGRCGPGGPGGTGGTSGGTGGTSGGTGGANGGASGGTGGAGGRGGATGRDGGATGGSTGGEGSGGTAIGTGGRVAGTGGVGTGGTMATGSGGSAAGTGGTIKTGTGGSGSGGTTATGSGGTAIGSGGTIATGSGGAHDGSGGVAASGGTGGSGGATSSGGGGTSVDKTGSASGCACAIASAGASSQRASVFFTLLIAVAVVLGRARTRRLRTRRGLHL
jgi:enterochelin esterase-like enzyme